MRFQGINFEVGCAGTIVIELGEKEICVRPDENSHRAFVEKAASTPLCLSKLKSVVHAHKKSPAPKHRAFNPPQADKYQETVKPYK